MLNEPTITKLKALRMPSMARTVAEWQGVSPNDMSALEAIALLVDIEHQDRQNRKLDRRIHEAKLPRGAQIEDVRWNKERGIDKVKMRELFECKWAQHHQNIILTGATGTGKSFFAGALARAAIGLGYRALAVRTPRLLRDLAVARATGRFSAELARLGRVQVLILDDFLLSPVEIEHARDLLEVIDDRFDRSCTILCSQVPTDGWHIQLGEPAVADAICDRIVHRAQQLRLTGPSMRKEIATLNA